MKKELNQTIEKEYSNIHGIVVQKSGNIVHQAYFNGYGPSDKHHVASVTKSIVSALIGIAVDQGYLEGIDRPLKDYFPEYDTDLTDITIRHLLTMMVPYPFQEWKEPLEAMCMSPDWNGYICGQIAIGLKESVSPRFKYASANAHLLSAILTRCTGMSTLSFANEQLFSKIGIGAIEDHDMADFGFDDLFGNKVKGWVKDPSGIHTGGWGLTLSVHDMARFGQVILDRGYCNGKQVIPESWVMASTSRQVHPGIAPGYGFMWWIRNEKAMKGIGGADAFMALGDGGNVICVLPDNDMVVAIASGFQPNAGDRWDLIQKIIS